MLPAADSLDINRLYRCIHELNQVMNRGIELGVLLETIVREVSVLLSADSTSVLLLDEQRQRLLMSAAYGLSALEKRRVQFQPGEGVAGWVIENGVPARLDDVQEDERFMPLLFNEVPIRSMLALPLMVRQQPIGVVCATHRTPGWFTRDHQELLAFLTNSVVLDVENARLYRMAITDGLTGLYNRQHLAERLKAEVDRAHRYDLPLTLLMADLDRFKAINDRFGHPGGDEVLQEVASRFLEATREVDVVARYGGEEFAILLPNTGREGGQRAAARLLGAIANRPVEIGDHTLELTTSIGGAVLNTREEPRDLLARADAALYQAKTEGRNRVAFNWLSFAGLS